MSRRMALAWALLAALCFAWAAHASKTFKPGRPAVHVVCQEGLAHMENQAPVPHRAVFCIFAEDLERSGQRMDQDSFSAILSRPPMREATGDPSSPGIGRLR